MKRNLRMGLIALLASGTTTGFAAETCTDTLYGINGGTSSPLISEVDTSNGSVINSLSTTLNSDALASDDATGRLYYVSRKNSSPSKMLTYYDTATQQTVQVGTAQTMFRLAMDNTGQLWGSNNSTKLYEINKNTGAIESTNTMTNFGSGTKPWQKGDIAFAPDGTLYLLAKYSLYTVNMSTYVLTKIGDHGINKPTGLAFDSAGNLIASNYSGGSKLYTVNTSTGGSSLVGSSSVRLDDLTFNTTCVTSSNEVPVSDNQAAATDEDSALAVTLTGSDADGDTLSFAVETNPGSGSLSGTAPNLSYTPSANFNGSDSFTFSVDDGNGGSATGTVSLTVNAVNDNPVADDKSLTTPEDTAAALTLSGSDLDGDALTFSVTANPGNGSLSGTAPNLNYTPNVGFDGSDSFTFSVDDGNGGTDSATVSITVSAVNDTPVADDQSATTNEDTATALTLTASDSDGDTLSFSVTANPSNGTLSGTVPNLSYTPNANFNGSDNFTFSADDGNGGSDSATVSLTVSAINDAPVADAQSVTTDEDTAVAIALAASDLDGDALNFSVTANPGNGNLSGTAPNLSYTPNASFIGSDSFNFSADDGNGGSSTATVSITVDAVVVASRPSITVMGYNIMMLPAIAGDWDQNQRADHLPDALRTLATLPDVIGYSEVLDDYSYSSATGMVEYPYASPVVGQVCSGGAWDSITGPCSNAIGIVRGGMMLTSQHPIEEQHALIFSTHVEGSADAFANKGAVYAKIDIDGYKYHIVATHLQATHDSGDDDEHLVRTDQLAEIRGWIDDMNIPATEPVILVGDLNVPFALNNQVSDMLAAGRTSLNFPADEGFGSYSNQNLMAKAFIYYFDDEVCYDDTLDYVTHRRDHLQPIATPEVDVLQLESPDSFYWSYLDGTWTDCGGVVVNRDGYTTDISDHYPVIATYDYPAGLDVAPGPDTAEPLALLKSDTISKTSLLSAWEYFDYFRDLADFPFEHQATEYSWVNAAWLADAAFLAYIEEPEIRAEMARAGLPTVEYYDVNDTQCFVANNDDFAIMSCRGTEPSNYYDWTVDLDFFKTPAENGGQVHQGFKGALDAVWTPMSAHLATLKAEGKTIWFTGHSLGGALAQVAADRFCLSENDCDVSGVFSFGAPAVGDQDYVDDFHAPYYRSVYYHDPVPRLPGELLGFTHSPGELFYYDYDGNYTGLQTIPAFTLPEVVYHAPYYYSVYTWNGFVNSVNSNGGSGTATTIIDTSVAGVIMDNDSVDFAETGTWESATAHAGEYEGANYRLSIDPAADASWSFKVGVQGDYEVFFKVPGAFGFTDTYYGSDATTFKVYNNGVELASFSADLYNNAYDFTSIATINFVPGEVYSVVVTEAYVGSSDYAIAADAIKVVYADVPPPSCDAATLCVDPTLDDVIIDNDNSVANHYSEAGSGWADKSGAGYPAENDNYRYSVDSSAEGQWTFNVAQTGNYQIQFRSPGGFSWAHGYGSDQMVYKVKEGAIELATTASGAIDLYYNAYAFGDVDVVASVALTKGSSYTVTVTGAYSSFYSYGIVADAIKLVHIP